MVAMSRQTLFLLVATVMLGSMAVTSAAADATKKKPTKAAAKKKPSPKHTGTKPSPHKHTKPSSHKHTKPSPHKPTKKVVKKPTKRPARKPHAPRPAPPPPFTAMSDYSADYPLATVSFSGYKSAAVSTSDYSDGPQAAINYLQANIDLSTVNITQFRLNALKWFGQFGINVKNATVPADITATITGPGFKVSPYIIANSVNLHAGTFSNYIVGVTDYPLTLGLLYGTTYSSGGFQLTVTDPITGTNNVGPVNSTYIGGPILPGSQLTYTLDIVNNIPTNIANGDSSADQLAFTAGSVLPILTPISSGLNSANPLAGQSFASTDVQYVTNNQDFGDGSKVISYNALPSQTVPGLLDISFYGSLTWAQPLNEQGNAPDMAPANAPPLDTNSSRIGVASPMDVAGSTVPKAVINV